MDGMDSDQREEFLIELNAPLDPMEQAEEVYKRVGMD
jgi:hypothetical protein